MQAPHVWADVDPAFAPSLARHVLRCVLATIRGAQHGGTLLIVPPTRVREIVSGERSVQVKYGFSDEEPRRRLLTLTLRIMEELARVHSQGRPSPVGWRDYETSDATTIVDLDEALFEVAHLIADLSQVDGAVVMTSHLDLLGFGAEITGRLPDIGRVARAPTSRERAGTGSGRIASGPGIARCIFYATRPATCSRSSSPRTAACDSCAGVTTP